MENPKTYSIYPPIKKTITLNSISVQIYELILFQSVKCVVQLYDIDNRPQDMRMYILTGEDYNQWANDDTYIITYCKKELQKEFNIS